jgi:hypothetical protein
MCALPSYRRPTARGRSRRSSDTEPARSIAARGVLAFPGSRNVAFAVAPMPGELVQAMVSRQAEPTS